MYGKSKISRSKPPTSDQLDLKYLMYLAHLTTGGFLSVRFDRTFAATQRRHRLPKCSELPSLPPERNVGSPVYAHTYTHIYIYIQYTYIYVHTYIYHIYIYRDETFMNPCMYTIYTSTYMYYHMLSYAIIHIYLIGGVNPSEKYERQLG